MAALQASLRDPHCGNLVVPGHGIRYEDHGVLYTFCSESCLRHFRYERG